jgi:hypothetical protein
MLDAVRLRWTNSVFIGHQLYLQPFCSLLQLWQSQPFGMRCRILVDTCALLAICVESFMKHDVTLRKVPVK